jgi:hypothetical protein
MKIILSGFCIFLLSSLTGFCSAERSADNNLGVGDSVKPVKIGKYYVFLNPSFAFDSVVKAANDTLYLVTCSDYVYSPFGKITSEKDLQSSSLRHFAKSSKIVSENDEVQSLKLGTNRLILFFDNDPSATRASYIIKGEINEPNVEFINGIKVGVNKRQFFDCFFKSVPKELENEFKIIIFESCVTGIKHTYFFDKGNLQYVKFECVDCTWKVDY